MKFAVCLLLALFPSASAFGQTVAKPKSLPMPKVILSEAHKEMVAVGVGESFPELSLPTADQEGEPLAIAERFGSKVTVVAFYDRESAMGKTLLRDLAIDIHKKLNPPEAERKEPDLVTIAIGSGLAKDNATQVISDTGYENLLLLDEDGKGFEQLGSGRLPRVYVLDGEGKIRWFDIEYSSSTRRELKQAVRALLK